MVINSVVAVDAGYSHISLTPSHLLPDAILYLLTTQKARPLYLNGLLLQGEFVCDKAAGLRHQQPAAATHSYRCRIS